MFYIYISDNDVFCCKKLRVNIVTTPMLYMNYSGSKKMIDNVTRPFARVIYKSLHRIESWLFKIGKMLVSFCSMN